MKFITMSFFIFLAITSHAYSQAKPPLEQARPWLGVAIDDHEKGVLVKQVLPDTPAEKYGIKNGDVITKIDNKVMSNAKTLMEEVGLKGVGVNVTVELLRDGKVLSKKLGLVARPDLQEVPNMRLKGKPAPAFKLSTAYGKTSGSLADHKGKVVLLQFWATWCPACRTTHDALSKAAKELGPQGLVVLAISDEDPKVISDYLSKDKLHFSALVDPKSVVTTEYFVPALPTMVIIDRQGYVQRVSVGGGQYFVDVLKEVVTLLNKK